VRFDDLFHNGKTETHPARPCGIGLEFLEDLCLPFSRDAGAGVADPAPEFVNFD